MKNIPEEKKEPQISEKKLTHHLMVRSKFRHYESGSIICDEAEIEKVLGCHEAFSVVKIVND